MPRPSQRDHLLRAAAALVSRSGAAEMTLEGVAEAAGVSKGGLLYHFPSKATLTAALVDDVLDRFEAAVDAAAAASGRPSAWAHAYVDLTFDVAVSRPDVASKLLAGPDADAELLARCGQRFAEWDARLAADGLSPATAAVVRYACDGWWTYAALGDAPMDAARDESFAARLHELIDAEVAT